MVSMLTGIQTGTTVLENRLGVPSPALLSTAPLLATNLLIQYHHFLHPLSHQ